MKYKVTAVTGTRADYGLLKHLLVRLKESDRVILDLVVTGAHLSKRFGNTQNEIITDGFNSLSRLSIPIEGDTKKDMALSTGEAITIFAEYFSKTKPELLVVLGDRYEILAATIAAQFCGIPIAHISGGDVTEGAVDDAIRHSITKMSQIHFPGCEQSRKRIIQMGEEPDRVFNVGEPGVENCLKTPLLSREELAESIDFPCVNNNYSVVTFHPVTMEDNTGVEQVCNLIKAMDAIPGMAYIITLANADAGGRAINDIWIREGERRSNWLVVPSLGVMRYLSAVKNAKLVIGNSSSGLIEAPSLGVPTINIGDRQKGRMLADSVICCEPICEDIIRAIEKGLDDDFQTNAKHVSSPFGDGTTSSQIEKHILDFMETGKANNEKHFYDIVFKLD